MSHEILIRGFLFVVVLGSMGRGGNHDCCEPLSSMRVQRAR